MADLSPIKEYPPEERRWVYLLRGLVGDNWDLYDQSPAFHAAVRVAARRLIEDMDAEAETAESCIEPARRERQKARQRLRDAGLIDHA